MDDGGDTLNSSAVRAGVAAVFDEDDCGAIGAETVIEGPIERPVEAVARVFL